MFRRGNYNWAIRLDIDLILNNLPRPYLWTKKYAENNKIEQKNGITKSEFFILFLFYFPC